MIHNHEVPGSTPECSGGQSTHGLATINQTVSPAGTGNNPDASCIQSKPQVVDL